MNKVPSYFSVLIASVAITRSSKTRDEKVIFFEEAIHAMESRHHDSDLGDSSKYSLMLATLSWGYQSQGEFQKALDTIAKHKAVIRKGAGPIEFSMKTIEAFSIGALMLTGEKVADENSVRAIEWKIGQAVRQGRNKSNAVLLGSLAMIFYAAHEQSGYQDERYKEMSKITLGLAEDCDPNQLEKELMSDYPDIKQKLIRSRWFDFLNEYKAANKSKLMMR